MHRGKTLVTFSISQVCRIFPSPIQSGIPILTTLEPLACMDFRLKPCTSSPDGSLVLDRLSSLPIELLIQIRSLLPTKDAVATCLLSRRISRAFPEITSLDFSHSPISHCLEHPYAIQRFPAFVTFVDTILHAYEPRYLSRFLPRLISSCPLLETLVFPSVSGIDSASF
ncbi:uncharacterized protein [Spinacia oleracea]|uniref:Uncharacterized protein isoform X2 n=1 Tax=Spinacia oleracea TaxID=3562 RepID=A0ABM3RNG9_SPIOL|nr:uncharacterized protein LOC130470660 isoform X2 [Spinacia oleracea]